jgi:hypothetical protein
MKKYAFLFALLALACGLPLAALGSDPYAAGSMTVGLGDLFSYTAFGDGELYDEDTIEYSCWGLNTRGINNNISILYPRIEIGYFILHNLSVGCGATFSRTDRKDKETEPSNSSRWTSILCIEPAVTYFFTVGEKLHPYASFRFGYAQIKTDYEDDSYSDDYSDLYLVATPIVGLMYQLFDRIGVYGQFAYSFEKAISKQEGSDDESVSGRSGDLRLGFKLFF